MYVQSDVTVVKFSKENVLLISRWKSRKMSMPLHEKGISYLYKPASNCKARKFEAQKIVLANSFSRNNA